MLALMGALIIGVLLALILSNRMSPVAALVLVPVVGALAAGFGTRTFAFAASGVATIAPTAAMFIFAILFFGVLTDAGLMNPIISRVLHLVGGRPTLIVPATALLALLVHLDGSGAVCFLVVIPAMLPVYDRIGIDRRVLACAVSLAAGVNFLPWTGPVIRSAAALNVSVMQVFLPLLPVQIVGLLFAFAACWWMGRRETLRLSGSAAGLPASNAAVELSLANPELQRPRLFWFNMLLALVTMTSLVGGLAPPAIVFMVAAAMALVVNYPSSAAQRARVEAHARPALTMAAILFSAGVFTGILTGTGALKAMATAAVAVLPPSWGHQVPFMLSLVAMPLSMVFDPDSFYFGVMPVLAQMHAHFGGDPLQVAQAALVGQMTAGFPVSPLTPATFLVAGLCGIELPAHQRFAFPVLYAASLCMALACVLFGVIPL